MKQQLRELYDIAFVSAGKEKQFETTHLDVAEKFAELIIQKCLEECEVVAYDADKKANSSLVTDAGRMLYEGMWGGAKNCAGQINYYFGLAE